MGCWKSIQKDLEESDIKDLIKRSLDLNNINMLKRIFQQSPNSDINDCFITTPTLRLNPLGYCLFYGKVDCFMQIFSNMGAQISKMEELFNAQGYRSIDIICIQGTVPMLEVYLPVYISLYIDMPKNKFPESPDTLCLESNHSIQFNDNFLNTPIQYACIHENYKILKYFKKFYKDKEIPSLFDVNYQEEINGENCPLITCRLGMFKMMKFLYEKCEGDFGVFNNRNENAILVLSAASNKAENYDYYKCMKYLLEVIKIDPTYKYEEVVLLINNYQLLDLYFKALKPYGIYPDKYAIEKLNQIKIFEEFGSKFKDFEESMGLDPQESSLISSIKYQSQSSPTDSSHFNEFANI